MEDESSRLYREGRIVEVNGEKGVVELEQPCEFRYGERKGSLLKFGIKMDRLVEFYMGAGRKVRIPEDVMKKYVLTMARKYKGREDDAGILEEESREELLHEIQEAAEKAERQRKIDDTTVKD
ncbi:MAG: hypothetical protein KJ600_02440 [Nanoarchaeota archaeon]|nr:hypothetical protein [Nanoarchaeota archaeon]